MRRNGVFAVLGNHDDDRAVLAALERQGVAMLLDHWTRIVVKAAPLDIGGIRFWTRRADKIAHALRGSGPTMLRLAYDPRRLREAAALNVGGVLSGHTHDGQVVLAHLRRGSLPSQLAWHARTTLRCLSAEESEPSMHRCGSGAHRRSAS